MGTTYHNKPIVRDGLVFCVDPANMESYPRSGTIATDLINNITGSLSGANGSNNTPQWENTNGGVFNFDGTDDSISTTSSWQTNVGLDNVKKLSFSAWVKPDSGTGSSIMAITSQPYGSWNGNFNITYRADITTLALEFRGAGGIFTNSSTTLAGDTWHHICFVLDLTLGGTIAQEVRCFVNNSEVANQSSQNPPLNFVLKTTSFNIGRTFWGSGGTGYPWKGNISNISFYNKALSASEVLQNYNALKNRFI